MAMTYQKRIDRALARARGHHDGAIRDLAAATTVKISATGTPSASDRRDLANLFAELAKHITEDA